MSNLQATSLVFGVFRLDSAQRLLYKGSKIVPLAPKEIETLLVLLENRGRIVEKEELISRIWPDTFVGDGSLARNISVLRKTLGEEFIQTFPRRGYRFTTDVTLETTPQIDPAPLSSNGINVVPDVPVSAPPVRVENAIETKHGRPGINPYRSVAACLGALAAVGLVLAAVSWWNGRVRPLEASNRQIRVAVLPFVNLTGDESQEYLCDGMTESLIAEMGRLNPKRLVVIASPSVMHYKSAGKAAPEIGRELNTEYLLESTVRSSGGHIRVTVQLMHAPDATHIWTGEYERDLQDIFDVQQQVSLAVAREVDLKLERPAEAVLQQNRMADAEAYRDYLLGRYYWNKRDRDSLFHSLQYFQRAADREPGYALAYAGLADAYLSLGGGYLPDRPAYDLARENANKALQLDNSLAEAYTSLAYEKFINEWDWAGADDYFQRAITLDPNYAMAHHWYALYLAAMLRPDDAIREMQRALDLDPLSLSTNYNAGFIYLQTGRVDDAQRQFERALEVDPGSAVAHGGLAIAYARSGLYDQSITEFRKAHKLRKTEYSPYAVEVAHVYAMAGRRDDSRRLLSALARRRGFAAVAPYTFAVTYGALGQMNEAFQWLQRSVDDHSCTVSEINTDPALDPLRSDPRFEQIRAEYHLGNGHGVPVTIARVRSSASPLANQHASK